ncbi:MAG: GAF domain-containing protein [Bacteroidales bacterium]|nr:GAF domain-containing protein [Bacteroidales bacterium]
MITSDKKVSRYKRIIHQIDSLINPDHDALARMATINAVLYHKMQEFFWVGFYLLHNDTLSVGPYQGPLACLVLEKNTGVCWTCIRQKKTIVVSDVNAFPGHIACNPGSQSEIAVPMADKEGNIAGVLDIDSRKKSCFDNTDAVFLEKIVSRVYNVD